MKVAVVGGGYAGLAAAVKLVEAGIGVDVFEASRTLGGRARGVEIDGLVLDNGAHILVGAYRETLRLMRLVGVSDDALLRLPLHLEFPGQFQIDAPKLPAPWHVAWALATARGLRFTDKIGAIRFMRRWQRQDFRLPGDMTVDSLLLGQSQMARRFLWEPLCLAALNTHPGQASAQIFLNVLRDSLAADRAASDLLLPTTDFTSFFPEPAARFIENRLGTVLRSARIETVERRESAWFLDDRGPYEQIIVAVAPQHLPKLVGHLPGMQTIIEQIQSYEWQPIVTAYVAYHEDVRLPFPMIGVADGTAQWLFDRGQTHGQGGLIAAVISARGRHQELDQDALIAAIHAEIAGVAPQLTLPRWTQVITEKRATFACTPDLPRPRTTTPLPGLLLAGDYVAGDYPATIEGAVRSGIAAARSVLAGGKQPSGGQA